MTLSIIYSILFLQIPQGVPNPGKADEGTSTTELVLYIVIFLILILGYGWMRRRKK